MLIKNPITTLLYEQEYKGLENIFDYWMKHRDELLPFIHKKHKKINHFSRELEAFELKIRWSSFYGVLFRFYIKQYIRRPKTVTEFDKISIKYGTEYMVYSDFMPHISHYVDEIDRLDLRGISLIRYEFRDTIIENIDFTHSSFDSSTFENVIFKNCVFRYTSFCQSKLITCTFDDACTFANNDFSKALIMSSFKCKVVAPILLTPNWKQRIKMEFIKESDYLSYTKIESETFIENKCS